MRQLDVCANCACWRNSNRRWRGWTNVYAGRSGSTGRNSDSAGDDGNTSGRNRHTGRRNCNARCGYCDSGCRHRDTAGRKQYNDNHPNHDPDATCANAGYRDDSEYDEWNLYHNRSNAGWREWNNCRNAVCNDAGIDSGVEPIEHGRQCSAFGSRHSFNSGRRIDNYSRRNYGCRNALHHDRITLWNHHDTAVRLARP